MPWDKKHFIFGSKFNMHHVRHSSPQHGFHQAGSPKTSVEFFDGRVDRPASRFGASASTMMNE